MKKTLILSLVLAAGVARADAPTASEALHAKTVERAKEMPLDINEPKFNEIKADSLTYSGIAVQAVKVDNLFQLFSPIAPARYGWGEDNLAWDRIERRISGLKFFSIEF
jgi:hypothetical protein